MKRLQGKVIVVAGGGGIGGGLARRYAAEGASVVLGDIDPATVEATVGEIAAAGGTAIGTALNGADEASVRDAVALAVGRFGGLDGFHANFASFKDGESGEDILGLPMGAFDEVMRVNARGFVVCTRAAIPEMLKRGGGSLVYTTSGAAFMGETVRLAYAMSKVAAHALVRHVANRFGREGIRANAIAPGVVSHARFEAVMDPAVVADMASRIPVGRLGRPEDIAAMGALLMSDEGSFITGQVLSVDGGNSMRQWSVPERSRRVHAAIELLDATDRTVGTIAADVGYENQAAFAKTFRAAVGMAPAEYRAAKRRPAGALS